MWRKFRNDSNAEMAGKTERNATRMVLSNAPQGMEVKRQWREVSTIPKICSKKMDVES